MYTEKTKKVKTRQFIKEAISVPFYLIVFYYLLPFSPLYLYYSAKHYPAAIVNELKKEKSEQYSNTLSFNKLSQNKDAFPKKDRVLVGPPNTKPYKICL